MIPLSETHLSTYGKLDLAIASSSFHCSLVMYRCTCRMALSRVSIGTPFSWYGGGVSDVLMWFRGGFGHVCAIVG